MANLVDAKRSTPVDTDVSTLKQKAREWLDKWAKEEARSVMHYTEIYENMAAFAAQCVAEEREACAKAVRPDDFEKGPSEWCALKAVQQAIRARKES